MRTQQEIIDRIEIRRERDWLNFEWPFYIDSLTFKNAKQFLDDDVTKNDWEQRTESQIKEKAIEYLPFAWEKANNHRGISASRSISHYIAWMWILGYDNTERWEDYEDYGKTQLREICGLLGVDQD